MYSLTPKEKKALIEKKMKEGDSRSYNELVADLELQIWTEKMKGYSYQPQCRRVK